MIFYIVVLKQLEKIFIVNFTTWIIIAFYFLYCLFYGYYIAWPMDDDILVKINKLSSNDLKAPLFYTLGYTDMLLSDEHEWSVNEKREFLELIDDLGIADVNCNGTNNLKGSLIYFILLLLFFKLWKGVNNMLNENSMLTRTWFGAVLAGTYPYSMAPNLSNLREEVSKKLVEIG